VIILLAGAGGQLGRDLQPALRGAQLHPYDHRQLDIADVADVDAAVDRVHPDWIINAAAFNDVDGAESAPDQAFAVNAAGAGNLAAAATRVGASILHISTDYVFDGSKGAPYTEDDRPNPLSVYARTKYEGEQRVLASGARSVVIRTAWLYGWQGKNFVKAILAAAEKGGPLRVVADQVGSPTATRDLAEAIAGLVLGPHPDPPPQAGEGKARGPHPDPAPQAGEGKARGPHPDPAHAGNPATLTTLAPPQAQEAGLTGLFHVVNAGACSRFEFARAIVGGRVEVLPITTAEAHRVAPRPKYSALTTVRWPATGLPALSRWEVALERFLREKQGTEH
jgi:dTDP-4-dehydrorhamnose reductase